MNHASSSSIQAGSSNQALNDIRYRNVKNFVDAYKGREKILHNTHPKDQDEVQKGLQEFITQFDPFLDGPFAESSQIQAQEERSSDGNWVAWREASGHIVCRPAHAIGPEQRFAGSQCEKFTFCAENQYLILPEVETLTPEQVKIFLTQQKAMWEKENKQAIALTSASSLGALVGIGGDAAIALSGLAQGLIWKIGALTIAPIWVFTPLALASVGGVIGGAVLIARLHAHKNPTTAAHQQGNEGACAPALDEMEMQETTPSEPDTYQRVILHFARTKAELNIKKDKSITVKGKISSTAFSSNKKHFFIVIDETSIQQWSIKTGEFEKSIEIGESSLQAKHAIDSRPASIKEVLPSPKGKYLLLVDAATKNTPSSTRVWLYSCTYSRIQSHFDLLCAQGAKFVFSPCEKWLAVLEEGNILIRLCTKSGAVQKKTLEAPSARIQSMYWEKDELRALGADKNEWKIIPAGDTLHLQRIGPLTQGNLKLSMFFA